MKGRRLCRLGLLITAVVLLVPPLLWVIIVLAAPTDWARSHVVAALQRASGRSAQLEGLHVCLDGGVELDKLQIGAPQAMIDPWLKVERMNIDVSLLHLLCGKFEPTILEVSGATLRVLRREDGSLELADLVSPEPGQSLGSSGERHQCGLSKLNAKLRQSRIILQDRSTKTELTMEGVQGEAIWEGEGAMAVTLAGSINNGPFQFTAHVDRSSRQTNFEGEFRATDVGMDAGMSTLRYLVPVLAGTPGQLQGRLNLDLYLRGRGDSAAPICKSVVGNGNLVLDPIQLDGMPLMAEISRAIDLPIHDKVGSIQSSFMIQDGRVITDRLNLTAGRFPIVVSGWTDFSGQMDYQVKLDGLVERVPEKARQFLSDLDLDLTKLTTLSLRGNLDSVQVQVSDSSRVGRSTIGQGLSTEDRDRLRVLGRRLRDKVLR
jgi:AsmA protein